MAAFTDQPNRCSYDIIRSFWQQSQSGTAVVFEQRGTRALRDGVIENGASADLTETAEHDRSLGETPSLEVRPLSASPTLASHVEIIFRLSISDGRFACNGGLPELLNPACLLNSRRARVPPISQITNRNPEMKGRKNNG